MADNLTKKQRSYCMSQIKSEWTTPERKVHNFLKGRKIKHEMYPEMEGSPDIILKDAKKAVFIHGCFWHKCPKCYKPPKSRKEYWLPKIERNVKRDKENIRILKKGGWKVIRIWEHEIKNNKKKAIKKIISNT